MAKKQRLGDDPFNWIQDTKDSGEKKTEKKPKREITKTSQEGLPENWTRATFIVREDILEKIKDLAYWDRKQVKQVVNEILETYIVQREKKDGEIKPRS